MHNFAGGFIVFYDRWLELCAEKGVRPTNACVESGLSRGLAAKWKATKTEKPSADALEKMAKYFGTSIDEILLSRKEKAPTQAGEREITMDDFTYAMHNESGDLTDDDKDWLLSMARRIAEDNRKRNKKPE